MKKFVFMVALMLATNAANILASENSVNETENVENYYIHVNEKSLSKSLGMSQDQMEICSDVIKEFENDMVFASSNAKGESRKAVTRNAIMKNMRYMKMFLDEAQYKKYVLILNTTLVNRGIEFEFTAK